MRITLSSLTVTLRNRLIKGIKRLVSSHSIRVGRWGEQQALKVLQQNRCMILKVNWRQSKGEVDIIARKRRRLIICEVKTRHVSLEKSHPAIDAIDLKKRERLHFLARQFLRNQAPICRRYGIHTYRVDAVEVYYRTTWLGLKRLVTKRWHQGIQVPLERDVMAHRISPKQH